MSPADNAPSRLARALENARHGRGDTPSAEPAPSEDADDPGPESAPSAPSVWSVGDPAGEPATSVWSVDDPEPGARGGADAAVADDVYVLPEIVPATADDDPIDDTSGSATTSALAAPTTAEPVGAPAGQRPVGASAPARATGWADHVAPVPRSSPAAALRAPGGRPRVRRVTRVLRHVDPWSTFKVALVFSAVAYVATLTSGVLLWRVADSTGTLANIERWFTQFGWETFELQGGEIFHNAWIIGLFGVVAATGGAVLLATLFNLVSDIVGGIRLTVLEEEVVERTVSSTRRYVVRRPGPAARDDSAAAWSVDDGAAATAATSSTSSAPPSTPASTSAPPPTSGDWSVDA